MAENLQHFFLCLSITDSFLSSAETALAQTAIHDLLMLQTKTKLHVCFLPVCIIKENLKEFPEKLLFRECSHKTCFSLPSCHFQILPIFLYSDEYCLFVPIVLDN